MKFLLSFLTILVFQFNVNAQSIIVSVAGQCNAHGYSGDGGPAVDALLFYPTGMTIDDAGNIFFCDYFNFAVRKVDTNGIITTIAGDGTNAHTGDGGLAINAQLHGAFDVEVDSLGNIYIAEYQGACIRKIDAVTGIITTVAGSFGSSGYIGDNMLGVDALLGFVYSITEYNNSLYIADNFGYVHKLNLATDTLTTIAGRYGTGPFGDGGPANNATLIQPYSITTDLWGNIYVGTTGGVRRIDNATGIITTVIRDSTDCYADSGLATNAYINCPPSVATDSLGNVYMGEWSALTPHIHKYDVGSGKVSIVAGSGAQSSCNENVPLLETGVVVNDMVIWHNQLYYADAFPRIGRFNLLGGYLTAQTNAMCNSSSGSFTIQGIYGVPPYTYSLDNGPYQSGNTFSGVSTGTHVIMVKDSLGNTYPVSCLILSITPLPTANFTYTQIDNFNVNFTNTSTAADSMLWIFPGNVTDTTTNPTFNFSVEGNYNVTLIAYNGCGADTIIIPVQVDKLSAIAESALQQFTLYPNPAGDDVTIQLQSAERVNGALQLVNVLGQVVYNELVNFHSTYTNTLDVSRLAKGLYVLCLQTEKGNVVKKLVVE